MALIFLLFFQVGWRAAVWDVVVVRANDESSPRKKVNPTESNRQTGVYQQSFKLLESQSCTWKQIIKKCSNSMVSKVVYSGMSPEGIQDDLY